MAKHKQIWASLPHPLRWISVAIVGSTAVVLGIVFLFLPGPGIPLIIGGLAILATEFTWAELLLLKAKHRIKKLKELKR